MYRFKGTSSLKMVKAKKRIKSNTMAKDLGMSRQYLWLIENKKVPVRAGLRVKISKYLGVVPILIDW